MTAPERVYYDPSDGYISGKLPPDHPAFKGCVEYIRADLAAVQPVQVLETCGKCMGSGYGGHPDSGHPCADCSGIGGVPRTDTRDEVIARLVDAATHLCDGIATMLPPLGQSDRVLSLRAALAAAKAVQK